MTTFVIAFIAYGVRYTFSMLLPEMMRDLNLTNVQAGLMYTGFLTLHALTSVLVGFLVDVRGVKKTVLMFLPFFGIGTGLMSLTFSDWSGALFFGIAGVGASVCWTPLVIWVQRAYPSRRGFFLGVLQVGCNIGFGVLGLVIPLMTPHIGWRGCWATLGVIAVLLPLSLAVITPEVGSSHTASSRRLLEHIKGFKFAFKSQGFWLGGVSYMLASFAIMIPMTFSKAYANLELGVNPTAATALFSITGFIGIIGAISIPMISDKIGRRPSIAICNILMAIGLVGSALLARTFIDIALWSIIVGISYGAVWPLYATLIKDLFGWEVVGSVTGLWTLLCGIGLLLSPPVGGLIADMTGSYRPTYMMGGVVAMASTLLALATRTGRHKPCHIARM